MIDFIEYYKTKNHIFGECMSHKDSNFMYVYIPKNASSWTKPKLLDWNWEFYNYHTDNLLHKHSLIVLRDPIERWLSGIAEYFFLKHKDLNLNDLNKASLDLIFDRIAFDDHTESQVLFLQNLNLNNCTFFWCDEKYKINFSEFLNQNGMTNSYYKYEKQHVTSNNKERKKVKEYFDNIVYNHLPFKEKLELYFQKDYKLIESVKYFSEKNTH